MIDRRWCRWPCVGCATVKAFAVTDAQRACDADPTPATLCKLLGLSAQMSLFMIAGSLRALAVDFWRDKPNRCGFGGDSWKILS